MSLCQKFFVALFVLMVILACVWVIGERVELQREVYCSTPHENGDPRVENVCP